MRQAALISAALFLVSCASQQGSSVQHYLTKKGLSAQTPQSFEHCYGYGCKNIAQVEWSNQDWRPVKKAFSPKPRTPEAERKAIKNAIAAFEQKVGAQTGTEVDEWGTFRKTGHYQHDCVDESTNTTIYLSLLEQKGLLKFHNIEPPSARFPLIHAGRWPHQTAVISEKDTSAFYVVDSWFHDNGQPPEIVPLKQWKEGWKPNRNDDSSQ